MKYGDGEGRWASYTKERTPTTAGVRTRVVYHEDGSKTVHRFVGRSRTSEAVRVQPGGDAIGQPIRKYRGPDDPTNGRRVIGIDWDGTTFEQPEGRHDVQSEGYQKMIARRTAKGRR